MSKLLMVLLFVITPIATKADHIKGVQVGDETLAVFFCVDRGAIIEVGAALGADSDDKILDDAVSALMAKDRCFFVPPIEVVVARVEASTVDFNGDLFYVVDVGVEGANIWTLIYDGTVNKRARQLPADAH
jgi:hypothetical protein